MKMPEEVEKIACDFEDCERPVTYQDGYRNLCEDHYEAEAERYWERRYTYY